MNSLQDVLSTIPIFSFLGRNEIAAVESFFVESPSEGRVHLPRRRGRQYLPYLLDGELEVFVGPDDSPRVLSILKKGDFFGEMVLLQGGKRTLPSW